MPFYTLQCRCCGHGFEAMASIKDRTEQRIACPDCGAFDVKTDYDSAKPNVYIKSSEHGGCPHANNGCTGCCGGKR